MQGNEFHVKIDMDVVIINLQGNDFSYVFWWYRILVPMITEQAGFVNSHFMVD